MIIKCFKTQILTVKVFGTVRHIGLANKFIPIAVTDHSKSTIPRKFAFHLLITWQNRILRQIAFLNDEYL